MKVGIIGTGMVGQDMGWMEEAQRIARGIRKRVLELTLDSRDDSTGRP